MKKIIKTILILLFTSYWTFAQKTNCVRTTYFGESEICLPNIEGYRECYMDSIVNQMANKTEVPMNEVIAFYLDNKTFLKKDSLGLFRFDNYFKVYGTKQIKDYTANYELLKEMQDVLGGNFVSKNWDLMKKEVDKIGFEVEIGVPMVINSYKLNKNSFTYVILIRYEIKGVEPYLMAMTINGLLLNERLIWMAYYLNYNGVATIPKLEENSNLILENLLKTEK